MIKSLLEHMLRSPAPRALSRAAVSISLAALAACSTVTSPDGLVPGQSDRAQVEARMGKAAEQIKTAEGGSTLFYPSGPAGLTTYAVRLRPDGVVEAIDQTLTPDNVRRVRGRIGRARSGDVMALLGPPSHIVRFPRQGLTAWDYRLLDGEVRVFSPEFSDDGVLRDWTYIPESELKGVGESVK